MNRTTRIGLLLCTVSVIATGCQTGNDDMRLVLSGNQAPGTLLSDTVYEQGKRYLNQGRLGLAANYFQKALRRDQSSVPVLNALAATYDRLRRYDLAELYYQRALKQDPNSPQTLNNLGYSYLLQGKAELAAAYLGRAGELSRGDKVIETNQRIASAALDKVSEPTQVAVAEPPAVVAPKAVKTVDTPKAVTAVATAKVVDAVAGELSRGDKVIETNRRIASAALDKAPEPTEVAVAEPPAVVAPKVVTAVAMPKVVNAVAGEAEMVAILEPKAINAFVVWPTPARWIERVSFTIQKLVAAPDPEMLREVRAARVEPRLAAYNPRPAPSRSAVLRLALEPRPAVDAAPVAAVRLSIRPAVRTSAVARIRLDPEPAAKSGPVTRIKLERPAPTQFEWRRSGAPSLEVSNGTGRRRMAARLRRFLGARDITAQRLTNADHYSHMTTTIYYRAGWRDSAQYLANLLPADARLWPVEEQRSEVRIELGADMSDFDRDLLFNYGRLDDDPTI